MASPPPVTSAEFFAATGPEGELPAPTFPEVAFAGRSNVGKSSLLNTLLRRRNLVRTSSTPGCTRAINVFEAKFADNATLHMVDLPGYGYARRSKVEKASWGPLIEGYLAERPSLRAVVLLTDVRRGLEEEEQALLEFCQQDFPLSRPPLEVIFVATKLDRVSTSGRKLQLEKNYELQKGVIGCSSVSGDGIAELWWRIRAAAGLRTKEATEAEARTAQAVSPKPADAKPKKQRKYRGQAAASRPKRSRRNAARRAAKKAIEHKKRLDQDQPES